jgi:hypothetical protein
MDLRAGLQLLAQVLDGPPGFTTRRLSSFLLIPVGINRQGFAGRRSGSCRSQVRAVVLGPAGTPPGQTFRQQLNSLFSLDLRDQVENGLWLQFGGAAKIRCRMGNVALLFIDFATREIAFSRLLLAERLVRSVSAAPYSCIDDLTMPRNAKASASSGMKART